jgi:hypothetical protein
MKTIPKKDAEFYTFRMNLMLIMPAKVVDWKLDMDWVNDLLLPAVTDAQREDMHIAVNKGGGGGRNPKPTDLPSIWGEYDGGEGALDGDYGGDYS